jgi:hypothetical protein
MKLVSKISKDYSRPQRVTHFWVLHSFPFFWTEITSWKIRSSYWNPQRLPHFGDQKSRSLPWWHRESFPEELWQGGTICLSMEFEHRFETPRTFQCWWEVNHSSEYEHLDHPFVAYSGCERTCNSFCSQATTRSHVDDATGLIANTTELTEFLPQYPLSKHLVLLRQ